MMSKQRRKHHVVVARQQTYKCGRRIANVEFEFKHAKRWRKAATDLNRPSLIQRCYNVFGPEDFGARRKFIK